MKLKVLRYWRDIEIFDMPNLPATTSVKQLSNSCKYIVCQYKENSTLPWEDDAQIIAEKNINGNIAITNTVYLPVVKKSVLGKEICDVISPEEGLTINDNENLSGDSCIAVFKVSSLGIPIENSLVLASFAAGLNLYRNNKNLDDVNSFLENAKEEFNERNLTISPQDVKKYFETLSQGRELPKELKKYTDKRFKFTWQHMCDEIKLFTGLCGLQLDKTLPVLIKSNVVYLSQLDSEEDEILNSFYLDDLTRLINLSKQNKILSNGLEKFISYVSTESSRRDILENSSTRFECLNPEYLPKGRWPSKSEYSLMMAQQISVMQILKSLNKDNQTLVSVNGPPGTGKTTLLSDIIAEIVVQRAIKISKLNKPEELYEDTLVSNESYRFNPLKKEFFEGMGIVVSSNNNSAVENITKELPVKIESSEFPNADYFSETMNAIFSKRNSRNGKDDFPESWGMVAGILGSKSNRAAFIDGMIYGYKENNETLFRGFADILKTDGDVDWKNAKKEFKETLDKINSKVNDFCKIYNNIELDKMLPQLETQKEELETEYYYIKEKLLMQKEQMKTIDSMKPPVFSRIFGAIGLKNKDLKKWNDLKDNIFIEVKMIMDKEKELFEELSEVKQKIKSINKASDSMPNIQGIVPDSNFFEQNISEQHLQSLWMDKDFEHLRAKLFIDALKLHESCIKANPKQWLANYSAVRRMLLKNDGALKEEERKQLWGILFFTVPVISTTLASFSRLFSGMGKESIGWLLIDEAGQATPQSVAGALWRAQRTVIIGDPIQIKPVVTTPDNIIRHLQNKRYELGTSWSPLSESAQTIADRTMELGAYIGITWTGLPLRAHRRCAEPMFGISNSIAYDGQMVQANKKHGDIDNLFDKNIWLNVSGKTNDLQLIEEEINVLKKLLDRLANDRPVKEQEDISIYIISPFKVIANRCINIIKSYRNLNIEAGTIHTFQGKESEIVILVLGTINGSDGSGSRIWASEEPNILNVAVTRAKLGLFVIGNAEDWKNCNGFDCMYQNLNIIDTNDIPHLLI